mgnify:CR=1 FL=1
MFQGLFNYDNPVWRFIGKLGDLVLFKSFVADLLHPCIYSRSSYYSGILCYLKTGT